MVPDVDSFMECLEKQHTKRILSPASYDTWIKTTRTLEPLDQNQLVVEKSLQQDS